MRCVNITREKTKFVGCLIPYFCFLNVNYSDFEKYLFENEQDEDENPWSALEKRFLVDSTAQMIRIFNGKSLSIEITEQQNELFIVAFTSTGNVMSNPQIIEAGKSDVSYLIKTNYSWTKGTSLILYAV